jgi:hypothetical protein
MSLVDGLVTFVLLLLTACRLFLLFCLFSPFYPFSSFSFLTLRSSTLYHKHLLVSISTIESGRAFDTRCWCSDFCFYVAMECNKIYSQLRELSADFIWSLGMRYMYAFPCQYHCFPALSFNSSTLCERPELWQHLRSDFGFATSRNTKSHIKASTTHCLDHGAYIWLKILPKDISR